ncbi:MlaC/ttg2D family ABC transporter substrate-binding protein [Methylobacterium dankookense]|uniref:Phospholipid-binding protein MlaC n=1 Tax=Methylobacterium dankookense TaxID=560405 RepID=A0A564FYP4_9HYPH|nr:ABC transporter substrate-binding protein [Methylobacterium dankookense]GJD55626.1 hypothetical protein IFDJLNFL_1513 [Methylobacterium dankookense]VUF12820.1 hypothetical protein MTDSW087_02515 [Methylobacterium dankookense]
MRLIRLGLLALALVAGPARAADEPALETVRKVYARFEETLRGGVPPLPERVASVGPVLEETFDFPAMVKLAVGQPWAGFTPEQQAAITEAFRRNFITTYANRLKQAAGGKFEVQSAEKRNGGSLVQTRVTTPDGDESQIDFVLNAENKVTDVLLNGNVSEVAGQRTSFSQPLKAGGADGLLTFLRQRTEGMLSAKPTP